MSTKARIGVRLPDGKIKSIHIWRDGHPDTLGEMLSAHYNTLESAMALVERGNIIDVEARLEECGSRNRMNGAKPSLGFIKRSPPTNEKSRRIYVTNISIGTASGNTGRSISNRLPIVRSECSEPPTGGFPSFRPFSCLLRPEPCIVYGSGFRSKAGHCFCNGSSAACIFTIWDMLDK